MPQGVLNFAAVPMPSAKPVELPASVETSPFSITRIRSLYVSETKIFPSPIRPVLALFSTASRTWWTSPSGTTTSILTFGTKSTTYAEPSIEDYAQRTTQTIANWTSMNGKQGGDPAKLADALIKLVSHDEPPVRWVAGADAVQTVGNKGRDLIAQADAYRDLSSSLAHDDD